MLAVWFIQSYNRLVYMHNGYSENGNVELNNYIGTDSLPQTQIF